jgi:uncharacterized protein YkwD
MACKHFGILAVALVGFAGSGCAAGTQVAPTARLRPKVTLLFATPTPAVLATTAIDTPTPIASPTMPATQAPPPTGAAPTALIQETAPSPVAPDPPQVIPEPPERTASAQSLLQRHNDARAAQGLSPYTISSQLTQAAQQQATYLATFPQQTLFTLGPRGHSGPDGSSPAQRAAATGFSGTASENWAYQQTEADAFEFWHTDAFHRPLVLSSVFTVVGFATVPHPGGGVIFVAVYG